MTNNTLKLISALTIGVLSMLGLAASAQNYIVGDRGYILKTTDRGRTWQSSNDSTILTDLQGIRVTSKDTIYTGGARQNSNGHLFRTVNGRTYKQVGFKSNASIKDIGIFANGRGYASFGTYATHPINQLRSTDNGATWGDDNNGLGISNSLDQVPKSNLAWSLLTNGRGIYKTVNGGNSWTNQFSVPSINSVERTAYRTIMVADGGRAFTGSVANTGFTPLVLPSVGTIKLKQVRVSTDDSTTIVVGNAGYTARSTDGGQTWAQIAVGTADLNFVEWATDSIVFIGGNQDATSDIPLFKSTDKGVTWVRIPLTAFVSRTRNTKNNFALDMNGPLLGVMASGWRGNGNENALYKTTDGGLTWAEYQGPFDNRNASCVKVFNADTMLVSHFGTFGSGQIFMSTNGGTTFNAVGGDQAGKYGFYFTSRQVGYVAAEIGLWKTINGGRTWVQSSDQNVQTPIYDVNKGLLVGAFGKALATTDYNTFTAISPLGFVAGIFRDVQVLDANNVFVAGDRGGIFRTTNSGTNWSYIGDTLKADNLKSVYFTSVKQGWAVGEAGIVYSTKDSARTWSSSTITDRNLNDVHFLNDSLGVIVGDSGMAFTTANAGASWTRVFVGTRHNLNRAWMGDTLNQPITKTFAYRADTAIGYAGQIVAIPVRVRDFNKIRGLQGSLTWDTTMARYLSVTRFGAPNLAIRNFNNATAATQGMLRFAWNDQPITIADDSILFVVSFRLKTAANSVSSVAFNGSWLAGALDSSRITVPTFTTNGQLTVIGSPTVTTNKVVIGNSVTNTEVCAGGTLKVPFTASAGFPTGNTFTAQLSNGAGLFITPVIVGTLVGTNSDTVLVTIPANAITGTSYRIRVNGSLPIVNGLATTDTFTITATPIRPTIIAGGTLAICPTDSLLLTAPTGFANYTWSNNAITQTIWVRGAGSYTVRTVTTAGCTSPASAATTTTSASQPNAPTVTATGSTTRCQGDSVTLTAPNSNAYRWSTGAITRAIIVKVGGPYSVQIRATATGCFSLISAPTVVTITPLPATPTITVLGGSNDSLQANVTGTTYLWFRDGIRVPTLLGAKVKWTLVGAYTVQVVAAGCTSAISPAITVVGLNDRISFSNTVKLYPNPNNGQFTLSISNQSNQQLTIAITDLAGRVHQTESIMVNQDNYLHALDLGHLAKGTYMVSVSSKAGVSAVLRTTVQ